jgi:hypothetical protein
VEVSDERGGWVMQPFVAALGTAFGLTSQEIADIIWLALQMQDPDGAVETTTRREASRPAQTTDDRPRPALTDRPDSTASDESPDRTSQTQSAELHLNQPNGNQAGFGQQLALNVPDARSLREPLSLARSLKPLLRRVVTGWSTVLDEAATVERIADEQLWLPVLKPALEPWLDLALVVDESDSMQIWQRTIAELQRLLSHYGVFRDVRVWGLVTETGGEVRLRPGLGAAGQRQAARRPSELIDPSGRRLILVATDCVAAGWQDGRLLPVLKLWATSGPLAIVQMLPEWLWSRTGLGFAAAVRLQGLLPGVPNQQLVATDGSLWDEVDLAVGIKVPVVTLEPEPFGAWTAMVAGKGGAWSPGFVFEPGPVTVLESGLRVRDAAEDTAEQRVQRFRVTASPMARRLAGLLAAAPVISLPVVRIIQDRLLAGSRQVHVAEVFLGGLLRPLVELGMEMNPDAVQYEFWEGVREGLLESVPTRDSVNVLQEVSQFVAERLGLSLDAFAAVLRTPQQAEDRALVSQSRPFAMVTAQILRQLGGEYAQFAEELANSNQDNISIAQEINYFPDTKLLSKQSTRSDLIAQIIQQRNSIAKKLSPIHDQLEQLLDQLIQPHDHSNLEQNVEDDIQSIWISSTMQVEERLRSLQISLNYFGRSTLNIGVVGLLGQGKSTFLQSISGLNNEIIPALQGDESTAVRYGIYHQNIGTYAQVIMHSEQSFLNEIIRPYYDKLGFNNAPTSLDEFAAQSLQFRLSSASEQMMYSNLINNYQANLRHYRSLLMPNSPKVLHISQQALPEFISPKRNYRGEFTSYKHLPVRQVNIFCQFPRSGVERLGLVDLPGLGDIGSGNARLILSTLGDEVDIVLFLRRPDAMRYQWSRNDFDLYDLVSSASPSIKNRSFMILNHTIDSGDNLHACQDMQQRLRYSPMKFVECMIVNCRSFEETGSALDRVLNYFVQNISELDNSRIQYLRNDLMALQSSIKKRLGFMVNKPENVLSKVNDLRKALEYL